ESRSLATLSATTINLVSVTISIIVLELYKAKDSTKLSKIKHIAKKLLKNPLVISILFGAVLSIVGMKIPSPVTSALNMLGSTTSPVAIFMLGVFLYGRNYKNLSQALKLSLLRMMFLPLVAFLVTKATNLYGQERATVVLMHAMPLAISMIILSERYDFYKETIASLILISSIGAGLYLNLWLILLNG
ncbi:MAG: AEC family transporter, partial [Candidatus Bathyarchaeia archaeon]